MRRERLHISIVQHLIIKILVKPINQTELKEIEREKKDYIKKTTRTQKQNNPKITLLY